MSSSSFRLKCIISDRELLYIKIISGRKRLHGILIFIISLNYDILAVISEIFSEQSHSSAIHGIFRH